MTRKQGNKQNIIRASEIGQFHFCSIAWYLQRCGYKPISIHLKEGEYKHIQLGDIVDKTDNAIKKTSHMLKTGYILILLAVFLIITGLIL